MAVEEVVERRRWKGGGCSQALISLSPSLPSPPVEIFFSPNIAGPKPRFLDDVFAKSDLGLAL